MRKHFLLLFLMALLPLAGFAQFQVNNYVPKGDFIYKITEAATVSTPGEVIIWGIRDGRNPVDENKALKLEGKITIGIEEGPSFDFIVNYAQNSDDPNESQALRKTYAFTSYTTKPTEVGAFEGMTVAESVVIPKEFLTIKENTFYGYTNMKSISFEANSEVKTIKSGAFNTTQISSFDFSNCSKLTGIEEGLFVQADPAVNSYVKTIILPVNSTALTTIGTAFQRLPNLTKIENLDQSLITTVAAEAFKGDTKLKTLALPATVITIAENAFQGSAVDTLTIDVTSLSDATSANVYGTSKTTNLKQLTLKGALSGTFKPGAFAGCTLLDKLIMNVEGDPFVITGGTIGASAFQGCTKLATLTFNDFTGGTIGANAFQGCTALTSVEFGKITGASSLVRAVIDENAFAGCTKLSTITFSDELNHVTIGNSAFKLTTAPDDAVSATALKFTAELNDVNINGSAFAGLTKMNVIEFAASNRLTIAAEAFSGSTTSATSAELKFDNAEMLNIVGSAFLNCTKLTKADFANLEVSTLAGEAFKGCTSLATVNIKNVVGGTIGTATKPVFPAVKAVTIGSVVSDDAVIIADAFKFANLDNTTLKLATGTGEYLENINATPATPLIAAGAFDFSAVDVTAAAKCPVVTIGAIKSAKVFTEGALKGNKIAKIVFAGDIATSGLDVMVIKDNDGAVTNLALTTLVFNGNLAAGAIAANAFAALPAVNAITFNGEIATGGIATDAFKTLVLANTITFTGKLAGRAVAQGAFEALLATSEVKYTYNNPDIDLTVNPFHMQAFKAAGVVGDTRDIKLVITNADLKAKYLDPVDGLTSGTGTFEVFRADIYVPVVVDKSFLVYPDVNPLDSKGAARTTSPRTAWARWELGARTDANVTGSLDGTEDLVIKRSQKIDGTNDAKITIYGTYTDEDDALETSTIYMVPLKVTGGYYFIPKENKTTLIVKVDNAADFTANSYKVECNHDEDGTANDWPAYNVSKNSIWTGLVNNELYVASNIMTNQQLIDGLAVDAANGTDASGVYGYYHAANAIDIYRGGTAIAEDLYIMSDPSKNRGFRIDKNEISATNNAFINTGWYYMLLQKYDNAAAPAHVVWLDDATEGEITGILTVKDNANNVVKSDAIYTLQGVRVSEMQKGQIYIVNGKKYIAK